MNIVIKNIFKKTRMRWIASSARGGLAMTFLLFTSVTSAETLTIDEAINSAIASNPALQAKRAEASAAKERVIQAYTPENPSIGIKFDKTPINTINVEDAMSIDYRISQTIPFPGKLISAGKEAKNEWKSYSNIQKQTALNIASEIKRVFYNILLVDKKIKLERENKNLFARYKAVAETKYATGKSTFDDPIKASLLESEYEANVIKLEQEKISLIADLEYLMGTKIEENTELKEPPLSEFNHSLEEIKNLAEKNQPALKAAFNMREAAKNKLTLTKQQYIPDIKAEFEYNQIKGQENAWTSALEMSIPLWFFGRQSAAVKEAKAMKVAAVKNYEETYNRLASTIVDTYERIRSSRRLVDIYTKTILPKASASLKSAEISYTAGKVNFLNVIESAKNWKASKIDYMTAKTDYETSIAQMETLTGGPL